MKLKRFLLGTPHLQNMKLNKINKKYTFFPSSFCNVYHLRVFYFIAHFN